MSKSAAVKLWRKRLKQKCVEAMGNECQCCGYNKCINALEFHHINTHEKEFSFAKLRSVPRKISIIINELKKCILVCSNCHKEIHANLRCIPCNYKQLDESKIKTEYELKQNCKKQRSVVKSIKKEKRKIFLSKEELNELLLTKFMNNKSKLAAYLGVSETAIRKKIKTP